MDSADTNSPEQNAPRRRPGVLAGAVVLVLALGGTLAVSALMGDATDPVSTRPPDPVTPVSSAPPVAAEACERWVASDGDDGGPGTQNEPWATIAHALDTIPVSGCVVTVAPGDYLGARVDRRYTGTTTLRAEVPYAARLSDHRTVIDVQGAANVVVEGFEIFHSGPGSRGVVFNIEDANDLESNWITVRNNIIHDSFHDDLLKIRSAARHVIVSGNVFYNQGPREQHIDVNGVADVTIEDNIFSNDFSVTGREHGEAKAFIVVKDSSGTGELGARRVTIRRNVFANYQGGREPLLQIGNDGKAYHEAIDVTIASNLLIGNTDFEVNAALGVAGVRNVAFVNNTVTGDLFGRAYGLRIDQKRDNPPNEEILLANNVYADATGTMGDFSNGDEGGVTLHSNLYWNGPARIPSGGPADPSDDTAAVTGDPMLASDHSEVEASIWGGESFASGTTTIAEEFARIVERYAAIPAGSAAVDRADPALAPADDITGRARDGAAPDVGAFEAR